MASVAPINFVPGNTSGYRESISGMAPVMIDPVDCPIYFGSRKTPGTAVFEEWLKDSLDVITALPTPPQFTDEPTYTTTLARSRVGNRTQSFLEVWKVSKIAEDVANRKGIAGGITSEVAREIIRRTKVMHKKIEFVILSNQAAQIDTGGVPALMAGFFNTVTTGVTALGAADTTTITEAQFKTAIQGMYDRGASLNTRFYGSSATKNAVSAFLGRTNSQIVSQATAKDVVNRVDRYLAPVGGDVEVFAHRTMQGTATANKNTAAALVDWDEIGIIELTPVETFENDPNTFRNRQGWIETNLTLWIGDEKAHHKFSTNNTI